MPTVNGAPLASWLQSCPPRSVAVSAALDAATADALDDYCARHRCTRSEAVRRILRDALRQVQPCR
jgi:metal-responsive CopG/Arc/MetJ family transcriptional regulator